jgi:hypothetical protein
MKLNFVSECATTGVGEKVIFVHIDPYITPSVLETKI